MRPGTAGVVFSMSSAQAARALDVSPNTLACLVEAGMVRCVVRELPWPQWATVRFDGARIRELAALPGELAAARRAAPRFRVPEVARAEALGMVLRTLGR